MTTPNEWQEEIVDVCATVNLQHVDLLLDQTAWNNCAIPALKQIRPEVPWYSLYTGTPEENLLEQAPLLMRLSLNEWRHEAWLEELMTHCANDARLLVVVSPLPFDVLSQTLQALSQMKWGGQPGLLRYYDPRIFAVLMSSILNTEQCRRFLQAGSYWGWLDRDQQSQWLQGNCQPQDDANNPPFLALSDDQCDLIGGISDAQQMLDGGKFDCLEDSRERRFALLYRLALQASRENYFGDLSEYVEHALRT